MSEARQIVNIKAGIVLPTNFSGNPKMASITFVTNFPDNNYAVTITGSDGRTWITETVTFTGFLINAQANAELTGIVRWQANYHGESL